MAFDAGAITGSISLSLIPLRKSLTDAKAALGAFKSATGSALAGIGRAVANPIAMAVGAVGVGAALAKVTTEVRQTMNEIDSAFKASNALGMTTEAFTSLGYAAEMAGLPADAFGQSMKIMQNNLADAAQGIGTAKDGLSALGLSAQQLASASPDQALGMIADALQSIQNPAQKTQAAMNIFGKQVGPELMAMLAQGSKGLDMARQRAEELGITFSNIDAAKVEAANDAMTETGLVIQGLLQKAAIEVAPYISAIAQEFTAAATAGGGFGSMVSSAVEGVAKAIAYAADVLNFFKAVWYGVKAAVIGYVGYIVKAIDLWGKAITAVINLLPGVDVQWDDTFGYMADDLFRQAQEAGGKSVDAFISGIEGENSAAVGAFFDSAKAKAQAAAEAVVAAAPKMNAAFAGIDPKNLEAIESALAAASKELAQFGMSDAAKKLADFSAMEDVTTEQIAAYKRILDQMETLKIDQAITDKVREAVESLKAPLDVYNQQLEEFRGWLDQGRITQEQFEALRNKAQTDVLGQSRTTSQAIGYRSAEDQRLNYMQARGQSVKRDPAEKQVQEQKQTNSLLNQLIKAVTQQRGEQNTTTMIPGL